MVKRLFKLFAPLLQSLAKLYFSSPRSYSYKSISGVVLPDVFYPHFTISTKLFMEFLEQKELKGKRFLELGCGTALISVLAAKKGAKVFATDINPKAIENAQLNAEKNGVELETIHSDLFDSVPKQQFDYIIINPPYYPKKPHSEAEKAWYCGENFEYFGQLFSTLDAYTNNSSQVLMILSEDCDLGTIKSIANKNKIEFVEVLKKKRNQELNFIYRLSSKN